MWYNHFGQISYASNSSRHKNIVVLEVKKRNLNNVMVLAANKLVMFPDRYSIKTFLIIEEALKTIGI
jgi:hypothetical protein